MESTIEREFTEALKWFKDISTAVGKQKYAVVRDCKEQSQAAWSLLLIYLDPCSVFHVRCRSFLTDVPPNGEPYTSAKALIDSLTSVTAVTNKHMARVKATLQSIKNSEVRDFIIQYLIKTVVLGIAAESVNTAVGQKVIPTFACMLAHKYFDHPKAIVGKMIAVTEKLDGVRALAKVYVWPEHVDVSIFSRQGKRIDGLCEIEQAIKDTVLDLQKAGQEIESFVLDGELLITDRDGIPSKEQYKRTTKIVSSDKTINKTGITYNVFDMVSLLDFHLGSSEKTYLKRRRALERRLKGCNSTSVCVVPVIQTFSYTDEERSSRAVVRLVQAARNDGKEGVMLNICDAPYVCKRTKNLLKVKVFQDCDLRITGFQQGEGKYANTLGALLVDYKGNTVGVGSGMTDEQRKEFWEHQDQYINRVVTVQYFEETNDANGMKSLRFPVFKELRDEGKEVSYE